MKWIIGISITFIGIIFIPLYLHFLNKPKLKYTISSTMTIETNEGEQNWQLMTVSNTGDKEANRIKIKIDNKLLEYKVIPFLQTDKYEGKLSSKTLDIEYSSLPPQGIIEIRLSVPANESVTDRIVNIVHDSGVATQATSKDKILAYTLFIFWIIIFIASFSLPLIGGIFYNQYRLRADACNDYFALNVLKRKKPFFISKDNWGKIRGEALENAFREDSYHQEKYRAFLNEDKPDYLNHEEYEQLVTAVSKKYANTFWDIWITYDSDVIDRIINNYKTKHPKNLTIKSEKEIEKEAISIFKKSFSFKMPLVYDPKEIESQYYKIDKSIVPENVKKEIIDTLKDYYTFCLARKILNLGYVENFNEMYDLNILTETCIIKDFVYMVNMASISDLTNDDNIEKITKSPKPNWMKDYDYTKLTGIAEKILSLDKLLEETSVKELKANEDISEAKQKIEEFGHKVKIINSELQIIDNLLKDPHSIQKVEEHSNPFSKGNFENLIKLSELFLKLGNEKVNEN